MFMTPAQRKDEPILLQLEALHREYLRAASTTFRASDGASGAMVRAMHRDGASDASRW